MCLSRCYHLEGLRGINHRAGVHTEINICFTYGYKKSTCDKVGVSALKSDSITNVRNTFGITKLFYYFIHTFVKHIFIHYAYMSPCVVYLFYFFHFGRACAFSFDHNVRSS